MDGHGDKKRWPGVKDFFTNLSEPIPLKDKISLLLRNNAIKIKNRQDCCSRPRRAGVLTEGERRLIRRMREQG